MDDVALLLAGDWVAGSKDAWLVLAAAFGAAVAGWLLCAGSC
jgi:hypothetical protein